jgi:predicted transcriptional regulator
MTQELDKLLFELSSKERMTILLDLQKNKSKLSHIAKKLELTITETSRHLQRLSNDKLIQKEPNGLYGLTSFGTIVLSELSGLSLVYRQRKYFLEHNISIIPHQFINRVGELSGSTYVGEVMSNIEEGENRIREAQELVWILSDQILTSSVPTLMEKIKKPFDLRIILPEGKFPPENKSRLPLTISNIKKRVLPKIDVIIVMTEEYATFCLPNRDDKLDYTGFTGTDPKFLQWCKDLFLYYWEQAKTSDLSLHT